MATKAKKVEAPAPDFEFLGIGVAMLAGANASRILFRNIWDVGTAPFWEVSFWFVVIVALAVLGLMLVGEFVRRAWVWISHEPRRINQAILVVGILIFVVLTVLVILMINNGGGSEFRDCVPGMWHGNTWYWNCR